MFKTSSLTPRQLKQSWRASATAKHRSPDPRACHDREPSPPNKSRRKIAHRGTNGPKCSQWFEVVRDLYVITIRFLCLNGTLQKSMCHKADLSPCNFATTHFPIERTMFISLQLRDCPFDSLHSAFFCVPVTSQPKKWRNLSHFPILEKKKETDRVWGAKRVFAKCSHFGGCSLLGAGASFLCLILTQTWSQLRGQFRVFPKFAYPPD